MHPARQAIERVARRVTTVAGRAASDAPEARQREPETLVVVDVVFERGLLFLALVNASAAPAFDVSVRFDPPFRGLGGTQRTSELALFANVAFLAPGREIRTLLDASAAYLDRGEPTRIGAEVSWTTPHGERRTHALRHDLEIYRELAYVDPEAVPPCR